MKLEINYVKQVGGSQVGGNDKKKLTNFANNLITALLNSNASNELCEAVENNKSNKQILEIQKIKDIAKTLKNPTNIKLLMENKHNVSIANLFKDKDGKCNKPKPSEQTPTTANPVEEATDSQDSATKVEEQGKEQSSSDNESISEKISATAKKVKETVTSNPGKMLAGLAALGLTAAAGVWLITPGSVKTLENNDVAVKHIKEKEKRARMAGI